MNPPPDVPPIIAPLTITYEVTRWDLFVSWMTILFRNRILLIFTILSISVLAGVRTLPGLLSQPWWQSLLGGVGFIFGFFVFLMLMQAVLGGLTVVLGRHHGVIGLHTLEISPAGLVERTTVNESLHRWPGVYRIFSMMGYLHIYVGENNLHLVPKRNLPPELIGRFETELRAHANLQYPPPSTDSVPLDFRR